MSRGLSFLGLPWFLRPSKLGAVGSLVLGLTLGFSLSLSLTGLALFARDEWKKSLRRATEKRIVEIRSSDVVEGVEGLIGNTPLVRIKSLSELTGVDILVRTEPSDSGPPRPSLTVAEPGVPFSAKYLVLTLISGSVIKEAEEADLIHPHTSSCVFEGTSGSTGISIAGIARSRGYKAHIVLPDDVAQEKVQLLEALGAEVEKVRPVSIVDKRHYVNLARIRAAEFGRETILSTSSSASATSPPSSPTSQPSLLISAKPSPLTSASYEDVPRGLFADQFENLSNMAAHEEGTGPEIWKQTSGLVEAFVSGAGTGGTIAGVGKYLKGMNPGVKVVLADPQGSGLFHKIHDGVMYSTTEAEGKRRRHQVDTVVEGIGLNRLTRNFSQALPFIDDAIRVTDAEAVAMSRHLAKEDGLFLGSSSAVNLVACVRLAKQIGTGRIVTILCDSGTRHHSRFWNDDYLRNEGIPVSSSIQAILDEE